MVLLKNKYKKGSSLFEFLFCFFIFALIVVLLYGSFGVVHSSILNSIAARTYAFASIQNRSNIRFYRISKNKDDIEAEDIKGYFDRESRFFGITTYQVSDDPLWIAPTIAMDLIQHEGENLVITRDRVSDGMLGLDSNRQDEANPWTIDNPGTVQETVQDGDLLPDEQRHDRQTAIVRQKHGYGICLSSSC